MKFYFCQTCGKRLTEHDIDDGAARNKKLKGVFCKECAVGVTTMDSLPMSNAEANALVKKDGPAPQAQAPRARRRTSGAMQRPSSGDSRSDADRLPAKRKHPMRHFVAAITIGAACVLLGLLLFLGPKNDGDRASVRPAKEKLSTNRSSEKVQSSPEGSTKTSHAETREPVKSASKHPTERAAKAGQKASAPTAFEALVASLKGADRDTKAGLLKAYLARHSDGPSVRRARRMLARLERDESAKPKKAVAKKPPPNKTTAGATKQQRLEAARRKAAVALLSMEEAVRDEKWVAVKSIAEDARGSPELKAAPGDASALVALARVFSEVNDRQEKAAAALLDGKRRRVFTKKKAWNAVIDKVEQDALVLNVEASVNGNKLEYKKRIALSDLTVKGRALLFGEFRPEKPEEWAAYAYLRAFEGDLDSAEKSLASASAFPLHKLIGKRIEVWRLEAREKAARASWNAIKELRTKGKWKGILAALEEFKVEHGETAFGKEKGKEIAAVLDQTTTEIVKREGLFFDFLTPENQARFLKVFSHQRKNGYSCRIEKGLAVFSGGGGAKTNWIGVAPLVRLGPCWDLEAKLNKGYEVARGGGFCLDQFRFALGFSAPPKKKVSEVRVDNRFLLAYSCHFKGQFRCGFSHKGDLLWKRGKGTDGPFAGMKGGQAWKGGVSYRRGDSRHSLKLSMRGESFKAWLDGKIRINTLLPPNVKALISASPLIISVGREGNKAGIEKLTFIQWKDEKK